MLTVYADPAQELQGNIEDQKEVLVRRNPAMADNSLLPAAFSQIVGDKVYMGLWKGYRVSTTGRCLVAPMWRQSMEMWHFKTLQKVNVGGGMGLEAPQ